MASQFCVSTGTFALVAATAKTAIEIPTGSTKGFLVIGLEVSFSLASASSVVVEWGTYTTTGTGTTVTPVKYGSNQADAAILGTVKIIDTVEPSTFVSSSLPSWVIPLPGMYSMLLPQGREFYRPASTNTALRINSVAAQNCRVNLYFEQ
jgi:hypothetical protein